MLTSFIRAVDNCSVVPLQVNCQICYSLKSQRWEHLNPIFVNINNKFIIFVIHASLYLIILGLLIIMVNLHHNYDRHCRYLSSLMSTKVSCKPLG